MSPARLFWFLMRRLIVLEDLARPGQVRLRQAGAWGVLEVRTPDGRLFWVGSRRPPAIG